MQNTTALIAALIISVGSKIFEKLVNVRLLNPLENCGLFLISSMILVPLNQWKI